MLLHAFLRLVHGRVGIGAVVLSGRILTAPVVRIGAILRRHVGVGLIVVHVAVPPAAYRVILVVALSVHHLVGRRHPHHAIGRRHQLDLPQRLLGVHAARVVRVCVAVLDVSLVAPCNMNKTPH